jgi:transcription elongation factor Elf1
VRVAAKLAGKRLKCPRCGAAIKVPGGVAPVSDDDDWLTLDEPVASQVSPAPAATPQAKPAGERAIPAGDRANPAGDRAKPAGNRASGGQRPSVSGRPTATPQSSADELRGGDASRSTKPASGRPASTSGSSAPSSPQSVDPNDDDADWMDELPEPAANTGHADPFAGLPPLNQRDLAALSSAGGFSGVGTGAASDSGDDDPIVDDHEVVQAEIVEGQDDTSEFRAKCPVCESIHYVKPKQIGKTISCGDCFSRFVVQPPPKKPVKRKVDIERAASFQLAEIDSQRGTYAGPEARSAAEYLKQAEDEEIDEDVDRGYENPDVMAWLRGMFGIFADPAVLAYWVALSFLGAIPGIVAAVANINVITIAVSIASIIYLSLIIACGFAIMESVAGGEKKVDQWPVFNPGEWIGQCLIALCATAVSAFPGLLVGYPLFGLGLGSLAMVMFSIFALFPFVLLSMLDNGSVFAPISGEVTKSITRCKESWGLLYFSSMLLFFFHFVIVAMLANLSVVLSVFVDCFLTVGLAFVYFSMIGQLAFQIGQAVNHQDDE